jgi:Bacterial Ig-like domain (group 3)
LVEGVTAAVPMTLTSSVSTVRQGTSFTLTAHVTASSPPGYVTFFNGQKVLGVAQVVTGAWAASISATIYTTGTANIYATYSGDYTYGPSVSGGVAVSVTARTPAPC